MIVIKKGDKYNKLTAIKFSYRDNKSNQHWLFKCDCGNEKSICVSSVKNNHTKSCGCFNKIHRMRGTRIYYTWRAMKTRCLDKNCKSYKNYGGRGINVYKKWLKFENFYKDMGDRPENKTLDRIDNNKGYYKDNCRWATPKEQNNNRRSNHLLNYKGKVQNIKQWADELGVKKDTLGNRVRLGWHVNRIIEEKINSHQF